MTANKKDEGRKKDNSHSTNLNMGTREMGPHLPNVCALPFNQKNIGCCLHEICNGNFIKGRPM